MSGATRTRVSKSDTVAVLTAWLSELVNAGGALHLSNVGTKTGFINLVDELGDLEIPILKDDESDLGWLWA
jgi:hypothetical protein